MYTNNVQRVNNRESIDSPFVSFKKLKYSYSVSLRTQLTPHADTSANTIPRFRFIAIFPIYPSLYHFSRRKNEKRPLFLFLARCLASRTVVSYRVSRSFAPRPQIFVSPAK